MGRGNWSLPNDLSLLMTFCCRYSEGLPESGLSSFLGGVAAAEGSETCTKSSEVQGGGDVAGVPKGVPFPTADVPKALL